MCRGQREKLKEDAIQCCGEKDCEKKFLDSVPYAPPPTYKTISYDDCYIAGGVGAESTSSGHCLYYKECKTRTMTVVHTCNVKSGYQRMCGPAPGPNCNPAGGAPCEKIWTQWIECYYEPAWCKNWKITEKPIWVDGFLFYNTSFECLGW